MNEEQKQKLREKLLKTPLVITLEDLKKAKEEGYPLVLALCKKCGNTTNAVIANARMVITKGCYPCVMETEGEWQPVPGVIKLI
jgi:hypothetical protein